MEQGAGTAKSTHKIYFDFLPLTMSAPITIPAPSRPFQTSLTISPEQVSALVALLNGANPAPIEFPAGKSASDLVLFSLSLTPSGSGKLVLSLK